MRLRVRQRLRGHFRLVQALFSQRLSQSFQRFFDHNLPVGLSKSQLHRRSRRGIAWRRDQTFDTHLVEKQILPCHEIQTRSAGYRRQYRAQVGVIARSIKRPQTLRDFLPVYRFPRFHGDSQGRFRQNLPILLHDADRHDGRFFRRRIGRGRFLRRLRVPRRSSRQERERDNASQTAGPAQFHLPFAQTKGSTAALPARSPLALSCTLAGASAAPAGAASFVNDSLQEKYSRQMLFTGIGPEGQQRLLASRAAVVGCGAIGAAAANLLVRAGVGYLRIIDRDFVEPSNLQRQTLFDESDALNVLPKAVAAERKLRSINSSVAVEGVVADLSPRNAEALLRGVDLLLDGTDNFETRFLINDVAVKSSRPWIYAAGVASYGLTMTIRPAATACLACLLESGPPAQGLEETCDTIGVLGPIVNLIASLEAAEALKLLSGHSEALHGRLLSCDVWTGRMQSIAIARNPECRACVRRDFTYLDGEAQPRITMCGRDSVQIHERARTLDLGVLEARLRPLVDNVRQNDFLLRFRIAPYEMTVFADGRAILKGTKDPAVARSLYARYIGA